AHTASRDGPVPLLGAHFSRLATVAKGAKQENHRLSGDSGGRSAVALGEAGPLDGTERLGGDVAPPLGAGEGDRGDALVGLGPSIGHVDADGSYGQHAAARSDQVAVHDRGPG